MPAPLPCIHRAPSRRTHRLPLITYRKWGLLFLLPSQAAWGCISSWVAGCLTLQRMDSGKGSLRRVHPPPLRVTGLNSLHPQPPLKLTIIQRLAKGGPLWVDLTHSGSWQQEVNSTAKVASSGKCKISALRGRRGKVSYKTLHVVCNFHDGTSQNLF